MNREFLPQGAEVGSDGVHYRVWAPACQKVDLEIENVSRGINQVIPLSRQCRGYFHGFDPQGAPGDLYLFRPDDKLGLPDPASRWQPRGVHGPSMVIDPFAYTWKDDRWKRHQFRDLVIYELHIGTFTEVGTFRAAIERLPHIRALGATAIEIMPIADFPGQHNWGYDGVCLYAPSRAYGHPDDLRALVEAAHQNGLTVILDVVYNHFGPDGNYLSAYIGDFLDETQKTPWGGAIKYGSPGFEPLRELIIANTLYWMREFHVDGFRLDATHAIMDGTPSSILQEINEAIHDRGGFTIAEDSRNDRCVITPESDGGCGFDGVWADDFHHAVRVLHTREKQGYFGDFRGSVTEVVETLRHGWLYRGQESPRLGQKRGTECIDLAPEKFIHCISNHDQVGNRALGDRINQVLSPEAYRALSAFLSLSPYTPLLFMGQEWSASTPFQFFTDHNPELGKLVTEGRREEFKCFEEFCLGGKSVPDPQQPETFRASKLNWDELSQPDKSAILELYKAFLGVRNAEPAFRPSSREAVSVEKLTEIGIPALRFKSELGDWLVLADLTGGNEGSFAEDPITQPRPGWQWNLVLTSNDSRFGGSGLCGVNFSERRTRFDLPELVLMREQAPGGN